MLNYTVCPSNLWVLPMCLAKLQVKPNTLTRRSARGAKEETPALSSEETTPVPISPLCSQHALSVQEQNGKTTRPSSSNIPALLKDSHQPVNQDNNSEELAQGQVDLAGKDTVELTETEASGSQAQYVGQIASVATSGPLTRWVSVRFCKT